MSPRDAPARERDVARRNGRCGVESSASLVVTTLEGLAQPVGARADRSPFRGRKVFQPAKDLGEFALSAKVADTRLFERGLVPRGVKGPRRFGLQGVEPFDHRADA